MNTTKQRETRGYSMANRADAAAETSRRILETTAELYWQKPIDEITLAMIAEQSGVTVQTVIRKFGGRDEVFTAAAEHVHEAVASQRNQAPVGDTAAAVKVLLDHYEEFGDGVMKMLSEEHTLPAITAVVAHGRQTHREWCERVFADELAPLKGAQKKRRFAQLVALCDVYTWKLLRRDSGLTRSETESAIIEMIVALKGENR
jgi:AcrR family transcriptional regulator